MNPGGYTEPPPELRRRAIASGEARVAVMRRTYEAAIDDVWDACTNPERLARWYVPVTGEFRLGGHIEQAMMGGGEIVRCEPPTLFVVSLGRRGTDEITLRLTVAGNERTELELEHATTLDRIEIEGEFHDAIFCMGGGYYPRLMALDQHLGGTLPAAYEPLRMHLDPVMRPAIERGSAAMAALLEADTGSA